MANNLGVTTGVDANIKTTDTAGVHTPHHNVDTISGTVTVASHAVTNAGTFAVQNTAATPAGTNNMGDVDVLTVITGTGATNLGKAIDSVAGATDTGVALLAIRDDALTTLTPIDGDYVPIRVSSTGAVHVTGGGGGTEYTEDAAAAADPVGQMLMAIRRDTLSASEVSADGDNIALKATSKGQAHVLAEISSTQLGTLGQTVLASGVPVSPASDWVNAVTGSVVHDTADSGNPIKQGFKAIASQHGLTLVSANDRTDGFAGLDGIQLVRTHTNLESIVSGTASNTDGTTTSVLAAGAAGVKHYLTTIILTNMHATSTVFVEIEDGATAKLNLPCPPGGSVFNLPVPLPGTAATAWNFNPSAATTTIYCSVIGFKSKI